MLRRCLPLLILTALAACLVCPAGALADAYTQVQSAYDQAGTGTIPPCQFSSAQLQQALKQAPSYDYQYSSDVSDAIQAALAARANGDCAASGAHTSTGSLGAGAHISSANTALPGSATAAGSGGLPLVLIVAFALAGAFLLVLAGSLAFGALGFDPRWGRAARHSLREAEYRIGASWDDLTDRLRR